MGEKRRCIFCQGLNLSNEHVFAKWLLKELQIIDKEFTMTHTNFFGSPYSKRTHSYSKLVNGLVCQKCNNGWMSQLESECQKHITNLMNLHGIDDEFDFLEKNYYSIAKWAFKNAILLNSSTNYRRIVPREHYYDLYSGRIPEGVFIDFSFCEKDIDLDWIQTPIRLLTRYDGKLSDPTAGRYQITVQIRHLLYKVIYFQSSGSLQYNDDGAISLFPEFGRCGNAKIFKSIAEFDNNGMLHIF